MNRCKQCGSTVVYVPDQMFHTCPTGEIREFVRNHVHVDGNNINGNIAVSKSSTGGDEVCHDNMENFTELFKRTCHRYGVIM